MPLRASLAEFPGGAAVRAGVPGPRHVVAGSNGHDGLRDPGLRLPSVASQFPGIADAGRMSQAMPWTGRLDRGVPATGGAETQARPRHGSDTVQGY